MSEKYLTAIFGAFISIFVIPDVEAQTTPRTIGHISGDVYEFTSGRRGTFMITSEGAVVVDPLDVPTAEWLKAEIWKRFKKPVTHVLYSHFHWDHASGGAVYNDGIVIAQAQQVFA